MGPMCRHFGVVALRPLVISASMAGLFKSRISRYYYYFIFLFFYYYYFIFFQINLIIIIIIIIIIILLLLLLLLLLLFIYSFFSWGSPRLANVSQIKMFVF